MKLPASVGQKKMKAIEQVLEELGIGKILQMKRCKWHLKYGETPSYSDIFITISWAPSKPN